MLANLSKTFKQAVLLNLDEDNQVHILGAIPVDQESNSVDLESLSKDSAKKVFKVRRNRSNSGKKIAKLVRLAAVRSLSPNSVKTVSKPSVQELDVVTVSKNSAPSLNSVDSLQKLVIDLSEASSHKQQIARKVKSEDSVSLNDSLANLSDDGFMEAYCKSLGYETDNCRKWAGYDAKSKSTNIASAKSDSDNDNKSVSSFSESGDSKDGNTDGSSTLSDYLMQLNMFTKMKDTAKKAGKGLHKLEKYAVKGRELGKKYYPQAEQAFAIVAPKTHDKYVPVMEKKYKAFNDKANQYGGWNTVHKAGDALQGVGLAEYKKKACDALEKEAHANLARFTSDVDYRYKLQSKIEELGC